MAVVVVVVVLFPSSSSSQWPALYVSINGRERETPAAAPSALVNNSSSCIYPHLNEPGDLSPLYYFRFFFLSRKSVQTLAHSTLTFSFSTAAVRLFAFYRHQLLFVISAARVMPTSLFLFLFLCRHKRPSGFFTICPCLSL